MILKDNFYTINELEFVENKIHASIKIDSNHSIFEGHFPNNPITPGVVEMEIVKEIVSEGIKKTLKMSKMSNCKFLAILNPLNSSEVNVNIDVLEQEKNRIRISAQILDQQTVYLKISAEYIIVE
jgi:3-hydroxyacyl-[acyl-carrier-protein] dehydratase